MLKHCIYFVFICFIGNSVSGQQRDIDSLINLVTKSKKDTGRVKLLRAISIEFAISNTRRNNDSSLYFINESLLLARDIKDKKGETNALLDLGEVSRDRNDLVGCLKYIREALQICEEIKDTTLIMWSLNDYALLYYLQKDYARNLMFI